MSTAWSHLGASFLRDEENEHTGPWAVGQGVDAPDRVLLRSLLTELEPCSLLDVGCGTGIELDGIRHEGLQVDYTGLDITPEFIEACHSRYPWNHFTCMDAADLEDESELLMKPDDVSN